MATQSRSTTKTPTTNQRPEEGQRGPADYTEAEVRAAEARETQIAEAARVQALGNRVVMLSIETERLRKRVAELEATD